MRRVLVTSVAILGAACTRAPSVETSSAPITTSTATERPRDAGSDSGSGDEVDAAPPPWSPPPAANIDGPHSELALEPADGGPLVRSIWYALPRSPSAPPLRLVAHLHGMCGPPSYACGKWIGAGTEVGAMVCPTGNARCGESVYAPPSWEAASWPDLVAAMDHDLEIAVAKVEAKRRGAFRREGAVLTGYSRGAYAAPVIARRHPNRWPLLVLIEANVPLSAESLRAAGVRALALVAGEQGLEIGGMRKTAEDLAAHGFPAKLFEMRRTGHPYSDDMENVMHDALSFVLASEASR